tara:strand:+ start:1046 stop:1309 length:264 start_codon:yes stop_codon:yes gene_type:complete
MLKMMLSVFIMMLLVAVSSFARPLHVGFKPALVDQSVSSQHYIDVAKSHLTHLNLSKRKPLRAQLYDSSVIKSSLKASIEAAHQVHR